MLMQKVLWQILEGAETLHDIGIQHRDIKPSNILCRFGEGGEAGDGEENVRKQLHEVVDCVLGDLSSGVDVISRETYYASSEGGVPGIGEVTREYAPPEIIYGGTTIHSPDFSWENYDSWSIGVVALEIMLGTPHVFSVDQR